MSETLSWDDFNMELFILSRSRSSSAEKLEAMDLLRASHETLRERVEELEAQLRLWRSHTSTFGGMPTDGEVRAALTGEKVDS